MENIEIGLQTETTKGTLIAKETKQGVIAFQLSDTTDAEAKMIMEYLSTKRAYRIPQSNTIDDYETIEAHPTDNETFFRLALCTLWANTGIRVIW